MHDSQLKPFHHLGISDLPHPQLVAGGATGTEEDEGNATDLHQGGKDMGQDAVEIHQGNDEVEQPGPGPAATTERRNPRYSFRPRTFQSRIFFVKGRCVVHIYSQDDDY